MTPKAGLTIATSNAPPVTDQAQKVSEVISPNIVLTEMPLASRKR